MLIVIHTRKKDTRQKDTGTCQKYMSLIQSSQNTCQLKCQWWYWAGGWMGGSWCRCCCCRRRCCCWCCCWFCWWGCRWWWRWRWRWRWWWRWRWGWGWGSPRLGSATCLLPLQFSRSFCLYPRKPLGCAFGQTPFGWTPICSWLLLVQPASKIRWEPWSSAQSKGRPSGPNLGFALKVTKNPERESERERDVGKVTLPIGKKTYSTTSSLKPGPRHERNPFRNDVCAAFLRSFTVPLRGRDTSADWPLGRESSGRVVRRSCHTGSGGVWRIWVPVCRGFFPGIWTSRNREVQYHNWGFVNGKLWQISFMKVWQDESMANSPSRFLIWYNLNFGMLLAASDCEIRSDDGLQDVHRGSVGASGHTKEPANIWSLQTSSISLSCAGKRFARQDLSVFGLRFTPLALQQLEQLEQLEPLACPHLSRTLCLSSLPRWSCRMPPLWTERVFPLNSI